MPIEETIHEMEGKISLLDNPRFIGLVTITGVWYLAFLGFLAYLIIGSGGF